MREIFEPVLTLYFNVIMCSQKVVPGIETLIIYLSNILKHPTNCRYFTIRKSNQIYRNAFDGFENETEEFLAFLGCIPILRLHKITLVFDLHECLTCTSQAFKTLLLPPNRCPLMIRRFLAMVWKAFSPYLWISAGKRYQKLTAF